MNRCPVYKTEFEEMDVLERAAIALVFGTFISDETTTNFIIQIYLINNYHAVVIFSLAEQKVLEVRTVIWNAGFIKTDTLVSLSSFSVN